MITFGSLLKNILLSCVGIFISISALAQTWKELNSEVVELYRKGDYEKAIPFGEKAIIAAQKEFGQEHSSYATSLNNLALLYQNMGRYEKAEPLYVEAMAIRKRVLGDNHPDYANSLNNLAWLYESMVRYEKAEPLYAEAMAIQKKALGDNHPRYASSLNNLALLYARMGWYEKAKPLLVAALEIRKKILGESHPDYATSLNNLALLYQNMGWYEKAEPLYVEAMAIRKRVLGDNHPDYANSLNNLAGLYKSMGLYEKAEPLYVEAMAIRKRVLGHNHPDYTTSLNNLGALYQYMGRYEKAELLYVEAMAIRKKILGESHPSYATSLNNLAELYESMGLYEKAEALFVDALAIKKKVLGESHPSYATSLNNLAALYISIGRYEKAEPLYVEAIAIRKKVLSESHPDYATSLNNMALLYAGMGRYEKAEPLFVEAKTIRKKVLGESHPDYANSLNNLAFLYQSMARYEKAEPLYLDAMAIRKKVLGEFHPDYATSLNNLALVYASMGQYEKGEPLLLQHSTIVIHNLQNNFTNLSEQEKQSYINNTVSLTETENSFLFNYQKASSLAIQQIANTQMFFKGLILDNTRRMLAVLQQTKDTSLVNVYNNWLSNKNILSKQYSLPIADRNSYLKETEEKKEILEKELNHRSADFSSQQKAIRVNMQDVQKSLGKDECTIEFVKFQLYNKKWTDSFIYAAYILRKDDPVPQFVPLCEEKQLGKYFSSTAGASNIKAIYRSDPIDENEKPSISGDSLYALVWKPLLPYLKGIKKVNYSPAGLLYKVAFHALPTGDSSLLMDKYQLNQYTSIRQLAINEEKKEKNNSIALFGNCLFSMDSNAVVKNIPANENASTLIAVKPDRSNNSGGWKQLEGTASEVTSIKALFNSNSLSTNTYVQEQATEEQFKSLSGNSPTILHLATHGFFLPDPEKKKQEGFEADKRNAFTLADDPLLRSGIVLSGANRVWSGQPPIAGREDGIVTAFEIAQMDLSKTDLVVLSACETALGDIKGNEGVFGLQRAFKLAGVKKMLLSLWKVPDAETALLMKLFYTYYLQGKTARESFTAAQKDMRRKYKPYYWAAFVLIE